MNRLRARAALSSDFEVFSWREGKYRWARFARGKLQQDEQGKDDKVPHGTLVRFTPDPEIFGRYEWTEEFIAARLRYYAHLNTGLTLRYNGESFKSKEGLKDLLASELGEARQEYETAHARVDRLEIAFTHVNVYGENVLSFVNGQHTKDGGTHQSAFREGLVKGVNEFAKASFAGEDVRDGLLAAVAVKIQDPVFESQTKNKLGSTDVRAWILQEVRNLVLVWLHKHPEPAAHLIEKIKNNERVRKELSAIKKDVRERERATAIRIPKLTDCRAHLSDPSGKNRERSTLFLTEGDSAGGGMVPARDVDTQAIFCLRGKPLNVHGLARDAVYKNEELYNIMRALGIENGLDGLRYQRVVIATDADVDGMHIRNLLLTYFLRYFEELVTRGHLFILETPLFRVRNKQETRYCYSSAERDQALQALKNPEITRFKGLGEISPKEFVQFIGPDIRLVPVTTRSVGEVDKCLEFFMGKNTPERRAFIEKFLIVDVP